MKLVRKQDLNVLYQVCVFGPISKQKCPPWRIPQKGGTLYSGARYVALWASCFFEVYPPPPNTLDNQSSSRVVPHNFGVKDDGAWTTALIVSIRLLPAESGTSFWNRQTDGCIHYPSTLLILSRPPRWRRGSGLDCGSDDPGSIPGIPSSRVVPLI